jgi:uncharacterized protein
VNPEKAKTFTLVLRIPGWTQNKPVPSDLYSYFGLSDEKVKLKVNGETLEPKTRKGYATIKRKWKKGDVIELSLPMPIRRVLSHKKVKENTDLVAVERGPLVYCAEAIDNGGQALDLSLADNVALTAQRENLLDGVTVIKGDELTLIPYYAWSHRGEGEMAVWLKRG